MSFACFVCALLQVCTMRSEEKSLRNKVSELQKIKNKFIEELEIKQRTILQLKQVFYYLKFYSLSICLIHLLITQVFQTTGDRFLEIGVKIRVAI